MSIEHTTEFDENYGEYSDAMETQEAKSIIESAKKELAVVIKKGAQELIDDAYEFARSNKELSDEVSRLKRMLEYTKRDYELKEQKLNREFMQTKTAELVKRVVDALSTPVFGVSYKYTKREKCKKCNDERMYIVKTPDGKSHEISCACTLDKKEYYVTEWSGIELTWGKSTTQERPVYFRASLRFPYSADDKYGSFRSINKPYSESEKAIADKAGNEAMFSSKKEAEKYAKYLSNIDNV